MAKRFFALMLASALALSLAACSADKNGSEGGAAAETPDSGAAAGNLFDWTKSGSYYYETETTAIYEGKSSYYHDVYAMDGADYAKVTEETGADGTTQRIQAFKKGGKMYVVNHSEKAYMLVPEELMALAADLQDSFSKATNKVGEGTGEIDGKALPYEEYESAGISTKYFMDNGQVYGYISEMMGVTTVSIVVKQSNKAPAELFEIPAGYTQAEE
jgi:hypothetical protein